MTSDIVTMRYISDKPADLYILGDADCDGEVTALDATIILRVIANFDVPGPFNDKAADVDGDDEVSALDATLILRYLADMKVPYPINEYV